MACHSRDSFMPAALSASGLRWRDPIAKAGSQHSKPLLDVRLATFNNPFLQPNRYGTSALNTYIQQFKVEVVSENRFRF